MISQKGSKQVRMGSRFHKLLSRDMKTKTKKKDQSTNNHKIQQKNKSSWKYNTHHGQPSHKWTMGDADH